MAKKKQSTLKKKVTFSGAQVLLFILAFAAVGAVAVWQSLAAPRDSKGKPTTGSGTIALVLINSTDGLAHRGQQVTFNVTTTATDRPFVKLNCYQGTSWIYTGSVGLFPDYPFTKNLTLANGIWQSGAADCIATLFYTNAQATKEYSLATMNFHVYE